MLDSLVLKHSKQQQIQLARRVIQWGFNANQMTVIGFLIGISALPLLAFEHYWLALLAILLNRLLDGLDGTIARLTQTSDRGGFLDIVLDFLFYSAIPLGFALASPAENALAAAVLIYSFIGTGSSFLAFAIFSAKRQISSSVYPHKSFYYLGGLTEATETILVFALMCWFPAWFSAFAYGFAGLCFLSTGLRIYTGWKSFAD
ncbi:MAG TPA: CDP-alcohol phosphatidyltransferase family protein [Thiolinea sp.]|nr:CDP-alcohol phosphatidyltransferase family protein [Thiolinea sp.]